MSTSNCRFTSHAHWPYEESTSTNWRRWRSRGVVGVLRRLCLGCQGYQLRRIFFVFVSVKRKHGYKYFCCAAKDPTCATDTTGHVMLFVVDDARIILLHSIAHSQRSTFHSRVWFRFLDRRCGTGFHRSMCVDTKSRGLPNQLEQSCPCFRRQCIRSGKSMTSQLTAHT